MPYNRSSRYTRGRRPRRKYKRRAVSRYSRHKNPKFFGRLGSSRGKVAVPFPMHLYTTLSYSEDITLTNVSAGVPVAYEFRGNGLYDPNKTGVGIQPRYFDSLVGNVSGGTQPYRRYCVTASKITLKIFGRNSSVSANPSFNGLFSLIPVRTGVTGPASITEMRERPLGKTVAVNSAQAWKPYTLSHFMKTSVMLDRRDLGETDLKGTNSANPTSEWDWQIHMCPIGTLDTGMSFDVLVSIKYYVRFDTLTDVADS